MAEAFGFGGAAPAIIVHDREVVEGAADGDDIADGCVDGAGAHVIGVDFGIVWVDALGANDAFFAVEEGTGDGCNAVDAAAALERADNGATLDAVVVLFRDEFEAGDVGAGEECGEGFVEVCWFGECWFLVDGFCVSCGELFFWQAVVEEFHLDVHDGGVVVFDDAAAAIGEFAEDGDFDAAFGHQLLELREFVVGNSEGHAFLRFADPDFPRFEVGVF